MEAIRHISEAALTDDLEKAETEIEAAKEALKRMEAAIEKEIRKKAEPLDLAGIDVAALDLLLAELARKDAALEKAAETFEDTAMATKLLGHTTIAEAMEIAASYTRAALGEQP